MWSRKNILTFSSVTQEKQTNFNGEVLSVRQNFPNGVLRNI